MLTGVPPFNAADDAEVIAKIKKGKYQVNTLTKHGASDEVVDLISHLLCDIEDRWSIEELNNHPWIL